MLSRTRVVTTLCSEIHGLVRCCCSSLLTLTLHKTPNAEQNRGLTLLMSSLARPGSCWASEWRRGDRPRFGRALDRASRGAIVVGVEASAALRPGLGHLQARLGGVLSVYCLWGWERLDGEWPSAQ